MYCWVNSLTRFKVKKPIKKKMKKTENKDIINDCKTQQNK